MIVSFIDQNVETVISMSNQKKNQLAYGRISMRVMYCINRNCSDVSLIISQNNKKNLVLTTTFPI